MATTSTLTRWLSRPTAKPYRNADIHHEGPPYLNEHGHVAFEPGDIENPHNWSLLRRIYVSGCAVMLVTNATFASSSPSGCFESISEYFGVSLEVAGLTITLFLLGYCAGPLFFAPLSEFFGRRYIFYITFLLYLAFNFLCAFAPNFGALLVGRFLAGTFVSAPLSNGPGMLADLWKPLERGNAMAFFSCMIWVGPSLGPIISGFLQLKLDWRWNFYVLLWLGGATALLMFTIPETYAPVLLLHKARRIRAARIPGYEHVRAPIEDTDRSLAGLYRVALTRPWIILFDPISFLIAIYLSVVYLLLYMLFSIYPIVFQEKRGWNSGVGELPLLGTIVGALLGSLVILYDSSRQRKRIEAGHKPKPEDRLGIAMFGGVSFAACMFWLAWSAEYDWVHWIVPVLAGVFLAASMMLIFNAYLNYLVDTYLVYAASAVAANTIVRSAAGASAPLFTNYMFTALGVGGGGSLIGGVAAVLAIIPFAFYKYGEKIRMRSRFAPAAAGLGPKAAPGASGGETSDESGSASGGPDDEEKQAARSGFNVNTEGVRVPVARGDDDVEDDEEESETSSETEEGSVSGRSSGWVDPDKAKKEEAGEKGEGDRHKSKGEGSKRFGKEEV